MSPGLDVRTISYIWAFQHSLLYIPWPLISYPHEILLKFFNTYSEFIDSRYGQPLTELKVPRDPEIISPEQAVFKSRERETRRDLSSCYVWAKTEREADAKA